MDAKVLDKQFRSIGAKLDVVEGTAVSIDVRSNKKGEVFLIRAPGDAKVSVVNADPDDRHLLLHVENDGRKSKFLCGHDERHWFVAAIPERAGATTVIKAKEALQPEAVRGRTKNVRKKDRLRRRNDAFLRQGEWFFVAAPDFDPVAEGVLVHRNEPLMRGGRISKPHMMEYAARVGGRAVMVSGGNVISMDEYNNMKGDDRNSKGGRRRFWTQRTEIGRLYAKGRISHSDHATIMLDGWHEVLMNTEAGAFAMRNVAFID